MTDLVPHNTGVRKMLHVEQLEFHMRYYTPKGWAGRIIEFDFIPYLSPEEFEVVLAGNIPDSVTDKYYIVEAIKDWQKKNLTNTH